MRFKKGHKVNKDRAPSNKGKKGLSIGGRKFEGVEIVCGLAECNEVKKIAKSRKMKINFCSPEHFKLYQKGKKWWGDDFREKNSGENSHAWKDIMVSESALHKWVRYHKGNPEYCIDCGASKYERMLDWSNQSGLYFRDLDDFVGRCRSCHKEHDRKLGYSRKKAFDDQEKRIGITIIVPREYLGLVKVCHE